MQQAKPSGTLGKLAKVANPETTKPSTGTTVPAPCPTCGCPLFWRPFTRGPVYCSSCHPPTNAKQWAMVVRDSGGGYRFEPHSVVRRLAPPATTSGAAAGDEQNLLTDAGWAANARYSEAILHEIELRAGGG